MNETRSWKTNYRGEVLIHAGKNPKDYTSGCYIDDPDGRHFQEAGITPNNFEELPRGSIIGKATLVNCIHINKEFRDHLKRSNPAEYAFGDYRIGRYAWVFENPVLFEKPIPARGKAIQKAARSRATTMNKSEKYSEIILLGQMLQERKIEHEQHDLYDGYQITVPLPEPTKEISVIEHQCSYGSIMNLLEIWADGSIQGYLSAKQTLKIIERIKARESPR